MSEPRVFHPRPTGPAVPPPARAAAPDPPGPEQRTPTRQSPTRQSPARQSVPAAPPPRGAVASQPAAQGFLRPMTRILRLGAMAAAIALPVFTLLGWLVAGVPGAWGALIGGGLAVAFFGITVLLAVLTARLGPTEFAVATLGGWLAKLVVLFAVLAALRDATFYSRPVLFVCLLLGTAGVLTLEALVVTKTRVPYTEPAPGR